MRIPHSQSKIIIPRRRKDLLSRPRLLQLVEDMVDRRVAFISAPAGYGKTSLLIDFAHQSSRPVCWLTLDPLDKDFRRFLVHFVAAIQRQFPACGQLSVAYLESTLDSPFNQELFTTQLINEIHESISDPFVFILDDVQFIDSVTEHAAFLNQFVTQGTDRCHLILSSRSLPYLPDLPELVARMEVGGLSFEELAFREDEIQALVFQNTQVALSPQEAEKLAEESEGWITALILSTRGAYPGRADHMRIARVSGVGLYEYLAHQVLHQQTPEIREFLMKTALMEEFDEELCREILEPELNWQPALNTVLKENLFLLTVGEKELYYRYHHLFQDFLQNQFYVEQPGEARRILERLAAHLRHQKAWEKGYGVYQRLGDPEKTAELVLAASVELAEAGRLDTILSWIEALPEDLVLQNPALVSLNGIVEVTLGQVSTGLVLLDRAVEAFREGEDPVELSQALIRRTYALEYQGNYQDSLRDAEEALTLLGERDNLRRHKADALKARGRMMIRLGQIEDAITSLERASQEYRVLPDPFRVAITDIELGFGHHKAGRLDQALQHYSEALDFWVERKNIIHQATLLNNMGVILHAQGNYVMAGEYFGKALDCARRSGYRRMEALSLTSLGDVYADLEALAQALIAYDLARAVAQSIEFSFLLFYLDLAEATVALRNGDHGHVERLLSLARNYVEHSQSPYERGLFQMGNGKAAWKEGRPEAAIAHFEQALTDLATGEQWAEVAVTHLLLAGPLTGVGREKEAVNHLSQAFSMARALKLTPLLTAAGPWVRDSLVGFDDHPEIGSQVSSYLSQVAHFQRSTPGNLRQLRRLSLEIPAPEPSLVLKALGAIQVQQDDQLYGQGSWRSSAARDLLFVLLAHPGGLSREGLGESLWPGISPSRLKSRLSTTIYRLRQTLGSEVVVFEEGVYLFNTALDYEYDVESYQYWIAQAQEASDPTRKTRAYHTALDLYEGEYLPGMEYAWVLPERERLRQMFWQAALTLGELELSNGHPQVALDCAIRVLLPEPWDEVAHRLAMKAHAAMNNLSAVRRQYTRCAEELMKEYETQPSLQTQKLFRELTGR